MISASGRLVAVFNKDPYEMGGAADFTNTHFKNEFEVAFSQSLMEEA